MAETTPVEWCASTPDEDVLERRHVGEEPDVLERARDAQLGDLELVALAQRLAEVAHRARGGLVDAGHDVEAGRLAGAVGPDEAEDLALVDVEADLVEGDDATEAQRDGVDLEQPLALGDDRHADVLGRDVDVGVDLGDLVGRRRGRGVAGVLGRLVGDRSLWFVGSGTGLSFLEDVLSLIGSFGPQRAPRGQQALRPEDREEHQRQTEDEDAEVGELPEALREVGHDDRTEDDTPAVALTTDDDGREEEDRQEQLEALRVDEARLAGEERARQTTDGGADARRR